MVYSEQSTGLVAYKLQTALGTQGSGSGASVLRQSGGSAGKLTKASVESNEIRADAMSVRGRHGSQQTSGSYDTELSLGNIDTLLEAVMRGTYGTADLALTQTDFTSLTTTTSTIVLASGSPITLGLRVGDVIRMTNFATTANNDRNLRITALSATTITVAETLTLDASADLTVTLTRTGRVLINPAAGSLVKRYFTIEENDSIIDASEVYTDCVWASMAFSMASDGLFKATPSWTGTGQYETVTGASAPLFTSPTATTGEVMGTASAAIRLGSNAIIDLDSFDLTIETNPNVKSAIAATYAPDVFLGACKVSMNLTMLREDLLDVANFLNETQLSLSVIVVAPGAAPKDFFNLYVPNFTIGGIDKSALSDQGGGMTQTLSIPTALIGKDEQGGAFDATMIKFQVSNAS